MRIVPSGRSSNAPTAKPPAFAASIARRTSALRKTDLRRFCFGGEEFALLRGGGLIALIM